MTTALAPLAQQLLNAQVAYFTQRAQQQFPEFIRSEVSDFFSKAETHTLADWLPKAELLSLLNYYLKDIPLSDDLAERIQRICLRAYHHPRLDDVCWGDLINEKELGELIDLALSLQSLHMLLRRVARNQLVIDAISDMMYSGTAGFMSQGTAKAEQMASSIPGAGSVFKLGRSVVGRATSGFEKSAEDNIKRYISSNIKSIVEGSEKRLQKAISDGRVKAALLHSWENLKDKPLASLKDYASEKDIEQGIKGGITFWREFRRSPYLTNIIELLSDALYQYADSRPVATLLQEAGVTEASINEELNRIFTPLLAHWHGLGWIEDFFQRQLSPFWEQATQEGWLTGN